MANERKVKPIKLAITEAQKSIEIMHRILGQKED